MQARTPGIDEVFCANCGEVIKSAVRFCPHCGARAGRFAQPRDLTIYSGRSRMAAGVLGVLLGALGGHRFYLGYISIGLVQLVVTLITGIGGLWGIIEGITILANREWNDADGKPVKKY